MSRIIQHVQGCDEDQILRADESVARQLAELERNAVNLLVNVRNQLMHIARHDAQVRQVHESRNQSNIEQV